MNYYRQNELPFKTYVHIKGAKDLQQALFEVAQNPSPETKAFIERLESLKRITPDDLSRRLD